MLRPVLALASVRLGLISLTSLASACEEPSEFVGDEAVAYRDVYPCGQYPADLPTIIYDRELVITAQKVVDDPCRTKWTAIPGCDPATQQGRWTAWYLFDQMRGTSSTSEIIHRFFETFDSKQVINTFELQERKGARGLLNAWRKASGCAAPGDPNVPAKVNWDTVWWDNKVQKTGQCTLDKTKAPFRLLAVVNRMDLRPGTGTGGYGGKSGEAGEGRLVFGFVPFKNGKPDPADKLDATVIFEYRLPPKFNNVPTWANDWHALAQFDPSTENFKALLQKRPDEFVRRGLQFGAPNNGSALAQIRTNEIDFQTPQPLQWSLREYALSCLPDQPNCSINKRYIVPREVAMTPDLSWNSSERFADLEAYMNTHSLAIMTASHPVDKLEPTTKLPFQGAESLAHENFNNILGVLWGWSPEKDVLVNVAGPNGLYVRHMFGLTTCIGCHYNETATFNMFIRSRIEGSSSLLGEFVSNQGNYLAKIQHKIQPGEDPADWQDTFNEPFRRRCEQVHAMKGNQKPLTNLNGRPH